MQRGKNYKHYSSNNEFRLPGNFFGENIVCIPQCSVLDLRLFILYTGELEEHVAEHGVN